MVNKPVKPKGSGREADSSYYPIFPGDPLPVPEVVEKDSDSVWALWSDAVREPGEKFRDTQPTTELMDLPDLNEKFRDTMPATELMDLPDPDEKAPDASPATELMDLPPLHDPAWDPRA